MQTHIQIHTGTHTKNKQTHIQTHAHKYKITNTNTRKDTHMLIQTIVATINFVFLGINELSLQG